MMSPDPSVIVSVAVGAGAALHVLDATGNLDDRFAQLGARGLVLPDYSLGRYGGASFLAFCLNKQSRRLAKLLADAASLVDA